MAGILVDHDEVTRGFDPSPMPLGCFPCQAAEAFRLGANDPYATLAGTPPGGRALPEGGTCLRFQ